MFSQAGVRSLVDVVVVDPTGVGMVNSAHSHASVKENQTIDYE